MPPPVDTSKASSNRGGSGRWRWDGSELAPSPLSCRRFAGRPSYVRDRGLANDVEEQRDEDNRGPR